MEELNSVKSRVAAEMVIKSIREGYEVVEGSSAREPPPWKRTLQRAVALLAEQLNTEDVHFVQEMIQNADDNQYPPGVSPLLSFHLESSNLRIDCNEAGFSERDVRALCDVNKSTKIAAGTIGEKGVGFKSVFKLADTVMVSSGYFSFMFDSNAELGMIAPRVSEFPGEHHLPGYTQFLLRLQSTDKWRQLSDEFRKIEPAAILFLRRLKHLHFDLGNGSYRDIKYASNFGNLASITTKFKGNNSTEEQTVTRYIISRFETDALKSEPKRSGVQKTEIVLAFPLMSDEKSKNRTQSTYAYLPIRDYGFKFIVQADFLLAVNREDVLRCAWNSHLISSVPKAFYNAISLLNRVASLRHMWIRYLPLHIPASSLSVLEKSIRKSLQDVPVLWSWAETLEKPGTLKHVPSLFLDTHQQPFLCGPEHLKVYLSPKYEWDLDRESLKQLGVGSLTSTDFLTLLLAATQPGPDPWGDRSLTWHEDFAKLLNKLLDDRPYHVITQMITQIPLVPLRGGSWTSIAACGGTVFLDHEDEDSAPAGIELRVIDAGASASPARVTLFKRLGIKSCSKQQVSNMILQKHRLATEGLESVTEAVSHMVYLYRTRHILPSLPYSHLWLMDTKSTWAKAEYLNMELPGNTAFSSLFADDPDCVRYIHSLYINAIIEEGQDAWLRWLVEAVGLSTIPRLIEDGRLSRAFSSIIANNHSSKWLSILRDPQIGFDPKKSAAACKELSSLQVTCVDGSLNKLCETLLPSPTILQKIKGFKAASPPLVEVDKPEEKGWVEFLEPMGVVTTANTELHVRVLKSLGRHGAKVFKSSLCAIYKSLGRVSDPQLARSLFAREKLIYIPPKVLSSDCVWTAPPGFSRKKILANIWPECEHFFHQVLQINNATPEMIADEIIYRSTHLSAEVEIMKGLVLVLAAICPRHFKENKEREFKDRIKQQTLEKMAIFPVQGPNSSQMSLEDSQSLFFVADRQYLHDEFSNQLFLLDFTVDQVHQLVPFLGLLGMSDKLLSNNVRESSHISGDIQLDEDMTSNIAGKASALARCASHWVPEKPKQDIDELYKQLLNVLVFKVDKITIRRTISVRKSIKEVHATGNILRKLESMILHIYLPRDDQSLQLAIFDSLPTELAKFLDIPTKEHFIGKLLQFGNEYLEAMLDREGVPKLQFQVSGEPIIKREPAQTNIKPSIGVADTVATKLNARPGHQGFEREGMDQPSMESRNGNRASHVQSPTMAPGRVPKPSGDVTAAGMLKTKPAVGGNVTSSPLPGVAAVSEEEMGGSIKTATERNQKFRASLISSLHTIPMSGTSRDKADPWTPNISQFARGTHTQDQAQRAREREVGIAGEKYVFDNLRTIIPDFTERHWTSTLKEHAKDSASDVDFAPYNNPEKADFIYEDVHGYLTAALLKAGYKEVEPWQAKPPVYCIEVKTTTGDNNNVFSMSTQQAQLIELLTQSPEDPGAIPTAVYAIFRVSHIETNPQLMIYLDPGRLMRTGILRSAPKDGIYVWQGLTDGMEWEAEINKLKS